MIGCYKILKLSWRPLVQDKVCKNIIIKTRTLSDLSYHLSISEQKAEFLRLKYPVVRKLDGEKLNELIVTLYELGYSKEVLIEEPLLFALLPVTLRFRHQVLKECALTNVTPQHIASYLNIVKRKTIGYLKETGEILDTINVENKLASYMTQWPTSLTTLIYGDTNDRTLYDLRLKIIQRYLELVLDLTKEEFYRGVETYPTVRHRPLAVINETLSILQSQVTMPSHKIKTNFYLTHVDPDNLRNIIYKLRSIGGIDIKEILRMHPKLATKNYSTLLTIRKVLEEFGIGNEAQRRCFEIYTLGPETIKERIQKAYQLPEFSSFVNHPRFLKMIYHNKTALQRMTKLYNINKKCMSLNILSGSLAHYESFEKAPGDRLGKSKDLIFCLSQSFGKDFNKSDLRNKIKRHPFWINIPLVQVQYVYRKLSNDFSAQDIYENCPIILYPWSKIRHILRLFKNKEKENLFPFQHEYLDLSKLSKSQKLSLVLYLLEKNHYFTGNGVWMDEKNRSSDQASVDAINK